MEEEYLLSLREYRGAQLKDQGCSINIGDVVIIKDESVARNFWKLAKVIELLKGSDGVARAALVNVATKNGPPKILQRSIKHLIPIEVSKRNREEPVASELSNNKLGTTREHPDNEEVNDLSDYPVSSRPGREAAIAGEKVRRTRTGLSFV